jgi:hypothetical protein
MGIDTRYWGPSGWQLFHLIAFFSESPQQILYILADVLPCKFCRASTMKFMKDHPLKGDPGKWMYDIHNMVNNKLRTQCLGDPLVVNPGEDPSFEVVKSTYEKMKPNQVPGRDFLFCVASNFPEKPEPEDMSLHREFIKNLAETYPFENFRTTFQKYLQKTEHVDLETRKRYMKWMYGLLSELSKTARSNIPTFKGYSARIAYYTSGCTRKTYKGKTCRRTKMGNYTKDRDNRRTQKVAYSSLLS